MPGSRSARRLLDVLLAVPVAAKVMGIVLGVTLLMAGGMLWQIHETWHRRALSELEARSLLIGADLVADRPALLLAGDPSALETLRRHVLTLAPDVEYLAVLDRRGRVLSDTLAGEPSARFVAANRPASSGAPRVRRLHTARGWVRDAALPIAGGDGAVLRVGVSERRVTREVTWLTGQLAVVATAIAVLGFGGACFLITVLARPIHELVGLTRAVASGDYTARARAGRGDELGLLAASFNEMAGALEAKDAIRERLLRQVISAAEEERKRVARELHDQTGQALASLIAGLGALECGGAAAQGERVLALRELAAQTLGEVHDLSRTLRPAALDDIGLVAALEKHCQRFASTAGMEVACEGVGLSEGARLPGEVELTLYRIVQEALTNAWRHGRAQAVNVLVQRKRASVLVVVEDDGRGFDDHGWRERCLTGGHLGLLGIEERAALLGGRLRIESEPGSGTSVFVDIPLNGEARHATNQGPHRG